MQYMINLSEHFETISRALSFEISPVGLIELEALMLEISDGAPEGMVVFNEESLTAHPVLLLGAFPMLSTSIAGLVGLDDLEASDPVSWIDAGYNLVGSAFAEMMSQTARMLMAWGTTVVDDQGYCPLEVMIASMTSGEPFDQVKTRYRFKRVGLTPVQAA